VGAAVGFSVGAAVGFSVGATVGADVGSAVGAEVGAAAGASVGAVVALVAEGFVLGCVVSMLSKSHAHRLASISATRINDRTLRIIIFLSSKKCAAEAAHEKCSLILLRHSSFP